MFHCRMETSKVIRRVRNVRAFREAKLRYSYMIRAVLSCKPALQRKNEIERVSGEEKPFRSGHYVFDTMRSWKHHKHVIFSFPDTLSRLLFSNGEMVLCKLASVPSKLANAGSHRKGNETMALLRLKLLIILHASVTLPPRARIRRVLAGALKHRVSGHLVLGNLLSTDHSSEALTRKLREADVPTASQRFALHRRKYRSLHHLALPF
ncbi:hypothetical protein B0F90DRAFT_991765 [Multifurca ochricompacta]|uniref:Uncharacterized protein n=1 Tax=Multifurca ochricompacta TaxID=376703 RepID=A0AAD4M0R4_9AGAM|nr:hypothetical protein B0F90DRAFT_991765 [Multifurca ochricompacta]